ncbi:MAG: right-handed parallel beta-helix repeat-containing protein [Oscillospiraceae bacterium]|nr:right-handed parallel beta-helix repeat-containing protein [Oscillospiraceae bacterium]
MKLKRLLQIVLAALLSAILFICGCTDDTNEIPDTDVADTTDTTDTALDEVPTPGSLLTYYVATTGSDDGDGSIEQPFATLEKARNVIRNVNKSDYSGITVYIREGIYHVNDSLSLRLLDSGTAGCPVTYASYPGEEAVFYGGMELPSSAFGPVTDPGALQKIPAEAQGFVKQANLRDLGINDYGELAPYGYSQNYARNPPPSLYLYSDGNIQTVARYPNSWGQLNVEEILEEGHMVYEELLTFSNSAILDRELGGGLFRYSSSEISDERAVAWLAEKDTAFLYGGWKYTWAPDGVGLRNIIPDGNNGGGTIELANYTTYGIAAEQKFSAHNLLCELDAPGEYYIDREQGLLFYYPHGDIENEILEIAVLDKPFITANNTQYITFSGLRFEMGKDDGIVITSGRYMTVDGCVIKNVEKNGISLGKHGSNDGGGYNNRVENCRIYNVGEHGVYAQSASGDRRTLQMADCEIVNNTIHSYAQVVRFYRQAVQVNGCGYRIANNLIYDSPSHAINYNGNDIIIEYNEIYDVMQDQDDAGAIYTFGDYTFVNCVIRYNYIHSLSSTAQAHVGIQGIYIDYSAGDVEIYGNVLADITGNGILANGGQRIKIYNNIFVNISEKSVWNAAFGTYFWAPLDLNVTPGHADEDIVWFPKLKGQLENMEPDKEPWLSAYPWVKDIFTEKWQLDDPADILEASMEHTWEVKQLPGETWDPERKYLSREPLSYWLPVGSETYENYIINNGHTGERHEFNVIHVQRPLTNDWNNQINNWIFAGHYYDIGAIRDNRIVEMDEDALAANFRDSANGDFTLKNDGSVLVDFPSFARVDFSDIGPKGR